MFLRLNRENGVTNIFNLDNVTNVYIDDVQVTIEFMDREQNYFIFYKEQQPEEYMVLKFFFEVKLKAYALETISVLNLRAKEDKE